MSGVEWMVLIGGLGLGWGVVSMLTGQRKRVQAPAAQGEAQAAPADAAGATDAATASTPAPTPSSPDAAAHAAPSATPDSPKAAP
jgi:hypothetical protein